VEAVLKPGFLGLKSGSSFETWLFRTPDRSSLAPEKRFRVWLQRRLQSGSREGSSLAPEKAPVWLRSQVNRKVETFFNGNVETFFNEKVETFFNGKVETFHWTRNGNVLNKLMHFPK